MFYGGRECAGRCSDDRARILRIRGSAVLVNYSFTGSGHGCSIIARSRTTYTGLPGHVQDDRSRFRPLRTNPCFSHTPLVLDVDSTRCLRGSRTVFDRDVSIDPSASPVGGILAPMPNQIVLSWDVDVANTTLGPTQAAALLGAVPLYQSTDADPVLGQKFGLTVASDVPSTPGGSIARRTLTLNMNSANTPKAPPSFPCHPITAAAPTPPYPLRSTKDLAGSFFVSNGAMNIPTTATQVPSLAANDVIQFLSQPGVFYTVASVSSTAIGLSGPYTGTSGNSEAFKQVPAPVSIAAIYSTSDLDTAGVATTPAIPAGSGARTVAITYTDSTGATGRSATASLTGKRPAAIAFTSGNGIISAIESISIATSGGFGNSVGQITLAELSSALPALPAGLPIGTGIGAAETTVGKVGAPVPRTFKTMTDEAQGLIGRALAYLPPSYFAFAQPGAVAPQLSGDFIVTTGSVSVPTTVDQTGVLDTAVVIEFAEQQGTLYTVAQVTPKMVTLTTPYTGIDTTNTGLNNTGTNNNAGTKGNIGTKVIQKPTGATLVSPSPAAPPTNAQLATPLAQFVALETAAPPLNPPLTPSTVPTPTFLSGLFTVTLQLALAVPVVPREITFV